MLIITTLTSVFAILIITRCLIANLYLTYVMAAAALVTLFIMASFEIDGEYESAAILAFGFVVSAISSLALFTYFVSDISKEFQSNASSIAKGNSELQIVFFIIVLFYMILTPTIISNPWWLSDESRILYMAESSSLLRVIKLTPIFMALYLVCNPRLDLKSMFFLLLISIIFSFYFGSKSGMIFLIATLAVFMQVMRYRTSFVYKRLAIVVILLFATVLFFFSSIAAESGGTILEELTKRLLSEGLGIMRALDSRFIDACQGTSIFSPIFSTLSKLTSLVDPPRTHLSYGNCLAGPEFMDYPFELLVPLYLELNGMYGLAGGFLSMFACLIVIMLMYKFIKYIGVLSDTPKLSLAVRIYFSYTFLAILWGGKISNYLTSQYLSFILLIIFVGMVKAVLKVRKVRFIT